LDPLNTFTLQKRIQNDALSIERIAEYALCLKIGAGWLELAVLNTTNRRFLSYEQYQLHPEADLATAVGAVIDNHAYASAGYWKKVMLISGDPCFSFVPQEFYADEHAADFLKANARFPAIGSYVLTYLHRSQNMVNVFAMNRQVADLVESKFPQADFQFVNYASCMVEGLLATPDKLDSRHLHLFVGRKLLSIAFFRNGSMHFLNSFEFSTPDDVLYFTLLVAGEHGLAQEEAQLVVRGEVTGYSALMGKLRECFRHVHMGARPGGFEFPFQFDELDDHLGFEVFSAGTLLK
jgi:hypothetical protein